MILLLIIIIRIIVQLAVFVLQNNALCAKEIAKITPLYFPLVLQITPRPTGSTRVPPGKNAARTPNTRRWSWRKSSSLTCISPVTAGTRSRGCSTSPRDRWKSGSKTAAWRWRNVIKTGPNTTESAGSRWTVREPLETVDSLALTEMSRSSSPWDRRWCTQRSYGGLTGLTAWCVGVFCAHTDFLWIFVPWPLVAAVFYICSVWCLSRRLPLGQGLGWIALLCSESVVCDASWPPFKASYCMVGLVLSVSFGDLVLCVDYLCFRTTYLHQKSWRNVGDWLGEFELTCFCIEAEL